MYPVLFKIGSYTVYSYGVLIATGFFVLIMVARRLAPTIGVDREQITDMGLVAIVGGLIGAYINYVISYDLAYYVANPVSILRFWDGGLVFLGGLLGGILAAVLFIIWKKLPLWEVADLAAILIPIGYGFGRLGCFMAGCCYGYATNLPWGIHFPGIIGTRHPTQLYSVLLALALILFALWFRKRRSFAGQSFLLYLMIYPLGRGLIELLRSNPKVVWELSVAQFTGVIIALAAVGLYPILARRNSYKLADKKDEAS